MKIEFPILESEPLIYFLLHSGVFVFALASLFFLLGMCMGAAIWGRYKKHLQHMKLENIGQLQEIAVLKRKLAEQTMRPSTSPLNPPPALLTEVLPNVSEIFPERTLPPAAKPTPAAPPAQIPPVQTQPAPALVPATPPVVEPVPATQPVSPPAPASKPKTATIRRPTVRVKSTKVSLAPPVEPAAPSTQANASIPAVDDDEVAPFGFLIGEAADPLIPSSSVSALAAIIKAPPIPVANPVDVTPAPPPAAPSVSVIPTVLPEFDHALGLVYKIAPPDVDDLTRIKGIASVLEKRLHDLGVYTWRQIASWEERHIREFSNRLAFKDRIVREKWVEQARSLNEARQLI